MSAENINSNADIREAELLEDTLLNVNASPHVHAKGSVTQIMWTVIATLVPAAIFGMVHFGLQAAGIILLGVLSAVGFEAIVQKIKGKVTVRDGSAALTGLLLAMCLPPTVPFFVPVVGSFIAIVIVKHSMGGLGHNLFNPAHIGRAALLVSWPTLMTKWQQSLQQQMLLPLRLHSIFLKMVDMINWYLHMVAKAIYMKRYFLEQEMEVSEKHVRFCCFLAVQFSFTKGILIG